MDLEISRTFHVLSAPEFKKKTVIWIQTANAASVLLEK
jgi:hypothetical protein